MVTSAGVASTSSKDPTQLEKTQREQMGTAQSTISATGVTGAVMDGNLEADLGEILGKELPLSTPLGRLVAELVDQVEGLKRDKDSELVKKDPLLSSQISSRAISGIREILQAYQRHLENKKEKLVDSELVRTSAVRVMLRKVTETMADMKLSSENTQLFIQTLQGKLGTYETEVDKEAEELKQKAKKE